MERQNVETFSCVDSAKVKKLKENLSYIDQKAVEFMRPGQKVPSKCDIISQPISAEDYSKCADEGRLDFGFMQRVAQQMPPRTLTCSSNFRIRETEPFKSRKNFHLLEDLAKMFDTSIADELFLAATCEETADTRFGLKAKAMLLKSPQLVALLSDVNMKDQYGKTPLIWAALEGHAEIAKELIGANADVNMKDQYGETPLMWAAENGHAEIAKELIGANADVNVTSNGGNTALIWAAKKGHVEIAKDLIGAKADVNVKNNHGNTDTLLIWAAKNGHTEIAKELIDAKANLNVQNHDKKNALILAAKFGHTEIAKELIGANADVSMKDHKGRTALKWANKRGHKAIANLIRPRSRQRW